MIYLKLDKKPRTVRDLLKSLFSFPYPNGIARYAVRTYFDKECTQQQCHQLARRSFDDIKELVHTYFPSVSEASIFKTLLTLKMKDNRGNLLNPHMSSCNAAQIARIHFNNSGRDHYFVVNSPKYNSKYTWNELLQKIGINSSEEYKAFIANKK